MTTAITSDLLTREQAAEFLAIKPQTLAAWLCTGRYPLSVVKIGRSVRYRRSDLERFIESRVVGGNSES